MTPEETRVYNRLLELIMNATEKNDLDYVGFRLKNLESFINTMDVKYNERYREDDIKIKFLGDI